MTRRQQIRVVLLAAAALALVAAAIQVRQKEQLAALTVDEIESQIAALDPATRAAVVARLGADALKHARGH